MAFKSTNSQICGGSLVAPDIVVTAAHCVHFGGDFLPATPFEVYTGRTTLSATTEGQEIDVQQISVAVAATGGPIFENAADPTPSGPDLYDPVTSEWDVVFLTLAQDSTSQPIQIAGPTETALWEAGRAAWVTGWGDTSEGGSPSDVLREVEINMIADSTCGSPTVYGGNFVAETMVCAGELTGGKDTCQGDSGGPLVVPLAGGGFRLVGDTSWGDGCARPNAPGVYGRVAADPIRSPLAAAILAESGVDVLGSGGQPPTPPPVNPPPTFDPAACDAARDKLERKRKKFKRAKKELKAAKRKDAGKRKIDRLEKRVDKARKKRNAARDGVDAACG